MIRWIAAILLIGLTGCRLAAELAPLTPPESSSPSATALLPLEPSSTPTPQPTPTVTHTPWPAFSTVPAEPSATPPPPPTLAASRTPLPSGTPTRAVVGLVALPADVNPLTGLKAATPANLNRRPVMIKVSNFPRTGRPHAGLSAADLVFEYYIGEFENRFLALYYSQNSSWIGPLRSGRLVDAELTHQYGGTLVYGNADPRVDKALVDSLGTRAITFDDAPCPPICGKDTHSVEGVFVNSAATTQFAISQGISNARPDLAGMLFDVHPPSANASGAFLGVMFGPENRGEWRYDAASGSYLRWIESERSAGKFVQVPLVDRNTGKQLAFENIIILFTRYNELLPTMHEIEISGNTGNQRAVFFRDGKLIEGFWRSNDPDQPLYFMNSWGAPAVLKPGKSWLILVGLSSALTQPENGHWELEFHTK